MLAYAHPLTWSNPPVWLAIIIRSTDGRLGEAESVLKGAQVACASQREPRELEHGVGPS
jgi:hypothetical protein